MLNTDAIAWPALSDESLILHAGCAGRLLRLLLLLLLLLKTRYPHGDAKR